MCLFYFKNKSFITFKNNFFFLISVCYCVFYSLKLTKYENNNMKKVNDNIDFKL